MRLRDNPGGTIDEYFEISIPSGAIKSIVSDVAPNIVPEFQFLLVRLREKFGNISSGFMIEFQFLLVRLRAGFERS